MVIWKVRELLDQNELSAYALAKEAKVASTTVYGLARGDHERVSLHVLDEVLRTLRRLTRKDIRICDLLEYHE